MHTQDKINKMYNYTKSDNKSIILGNSKTTPFLDLLKSKWDNVHEESGVFRYKINNLQEKIVGKYLLQLNPDRSTKRRQPEQIDKICQPFDENKFNFNKVSPKEILFNMVKEKDSDVHTVLVNVSPISRYHSLLCPAVSKCLPQIITEDSLIVALEVMFLAQNRDLRIGFNSLCALASVNHLHYHLFIEPSTLPVETVKCKHIKGPLYSFEDYPAPGFCFQITSEDSINEISRQIYKLISYLLENSIAHNLFITRGTNLVLESDKEVVRVVIWPRKSSVGAKQFAAFNIAVLELSGWFPVYDEKDFRNLKPETLEQELRKWKIADFSQLSDEVKSLF
ncbi:GDP-D-glucose phosphorylase 1 [Pectinophora gossypiella]|uniref:GDP-D-glucose phosphorylase 1 n=1 Tax=Pectinophora gossypiella TaxID=13191 RepID=UPI00214E4AF3|nr:GDP-D-glucose phosphorylase 1 [Pectinophora gossypiella]